MCFFLTIRILLVAGISVLGIYKGMVWPLFTALTIFSTRELLMLFIGDISEQPEIQEYLFVTLIILMEVVAWLMLTGMVVYG